MSDQARDQDLTTSPFYHSAVNAVTQPSSATWCSNYFIERWMPLLGNEGTRIVLALRRHGYNNRRTGEKREQIKISRAALAALVGCSEDTLTREIGGINRKTGRPHNTWLHLFVRKFEHKKRDAQGRLWQEENGYWVAMDDPVHPDDWHLVEEYVREREHLLDKGEVVTTRPETQNAAPVPAPETQNASSGAQIASPETQNASAPPQNASRYIESESDSSRLELTSPDAAAPPGGFASLFPEVPAPADASHRPEQPSRAKPLAWRDLSEEERAPWLAQAEPDVEATRGAMEEALWTKVRSKLLASRAQTHYERACRTIG